MRYLLFVLIFSVAALTACSSNGGSSSSGDDLPLITGTGELRFTLTWDNTADLDLVVTDPLGREWFPVNDIAGFGPEIIAWSPPRDPAPNGNYLVQVEHYEGPLPASYTVTIRSTAGTRTYRGTMRTSGSVNNVVTIRYRQVTRNSNSANHITGEATRANYIADKTKEEGCLVDCDGGKDLNDIHNISTIKINTTMSDGEVVIYGILINGSLINGTIESLD